MVDAAKKVTSGSWKTTGLGLTTIVTAACTMILTPLLDENPATVPLWAEFVPIAMAGLVGLFARDNGVRSEAVGAK